MKINDKKIVVYSATNAHGYLTSIIHRLKYNKNAYAIYVGEKESALRLGGNSLFDKCILFNHIVGPWGKYNYLNSDELEVFITEYFDNEFKKINVNIYDVSEFYIGAYWSDFPIYINIKGIKHNVFQEAAGDMGMLSVFDNRFPGKSTLQEKYGIFKKLDNPNIINAFISKETVDQIGQHDKIKIFDIKDELIKLDDNDKALLIKTFNIPSNFNEKNASILILTNWFTKQGETWVGNEPIKMYSIMADLYSDHCGINYSVYIKPHPGEPNKDNYVRYLENINYFDYKLPSEFLEIIPNIHFDAAFTVSSTSINSVKTFTSDTYSLQGFTSLYDRIIRIYACMRICKTINMDCFYFGVFDNIVHPLTKFNYDILPSKSKWIEIQNEEIPQNSIIIINDLIWRDDQQHLKLSIFNKLPSNSAVFIISDDISNFVRDKEDAKNIINITGFSIGISPYRKNSVFISETQEIYLYCTNKMLRTLINNVELLDIFKISGITIKKILFSDFDNMSLQTMLYNGASKGEHK